MAAASDASENPGPAQPESASRILVPEDLVDQDALDPHQKLVVTALLGALDKGKVEVPMLPDQAAAALSVAMNANADFAAYEAAIKPNAAMTALLLKAANSPLYGAAREITSVRQAMLMLGTAALSQLVMQVVVEMQRFSETLDESFVAAENHHALAVAHLAQRVADKLDIDTGEAFLCGLLHDLGRLLFPELAHACNMNLEPAPSTMLCHQLHPALGFVVCRAWKLPAVVLDAVSYHHAYQAVPGGHAYSQMGHLIAVTEAALELHGLERDHARVDGTDIREYYPTIGEALGLSSADMNEIDTQAIAILERLGL